MTRTEHPGQAPNTRPRHWPPKPLTTLCNPSGSKLTRRHESHEPGALEAAPRPGRGEGGNKSPSSHKAAPLILPPQLPHLPLSPLLPDWTTQASRVQSELKMSLGQQRPLPARLRRRWGQMTASYSAAPLPTPPGLWPLPSSQPPGCIAPMVLLKSV